MTSPTAQDDGDDVIFQGSPSGDDVEFYDHDGTTHHSFSRGVLARARARGFVEDAVFEEVPFDESPVAPVRMAPLPLSAAEPVDKHLAMAQLLATPVRSARDVGGGVGLELSSVGYEDVPQVLASSLLRRSAIVRDDGTYVVDGVTVPAADVAVQGQSGSMNTSPPLMDKGAPDLAARSVWPRVLSCALLLVLMSAVVAGVACYLGAFPAVVGCMSVAMNGFAGPSSALALNVAQVPVEPCGMIAFVPLHSSSVLLL